MWWGHPRRDEFLAAADAARADDTPFLRTAYEWWDDDLLDAGHPVRLEMEAAGIDRLILAEAGIPDPSRDRRDAPKCDMIDRRELPRHGAGHDGPRRG